MNDRAEATGPMLAITGRKPSANFAPTSPRAAFKLVWRDDVDHGIPNSDAFAIIVEADGVKWTQWIPRYTGNTAHWSDVVYLLRNLADDIEEAFGRANAQA